MYYDYKMLSVIAYVNMNFNMTSLWLWWRCQPTTDVAGVVDWCMWWRHPWEVTWNTWALLANCWQRRWWVWYVVLCFLHRDDANVDVWCGSGLSRAGKNAGVAMTCLVSMPDVCWILYARLKLMECVCCSVCWLDWDWFRLELSGPLGY